MSFKFNEVSSIVGLIPLKPDSDFNLNLQLGMQLCGFDLSG